MSTAPGSLTTEITRNPAWLVAAFRAIGHDIWIGVEKARTDAIAKSVACKDWCYAADCELATYLPMPRTSVVTKGVGLCAWTNAPHTYKVPDELFDAICRTPLPEGSYLRQYLNTPDLVVYIETPGYEGILAPHGKTTYGVFAYYVRRVDGRRELALMLNHGDDTSVFSVPDHGSLEESLNNMVFPSKKRIPPEKMYHIREMLSLVLFVTTYRELDEDEPKLADGHYESLVGRRLLRGQGTCKVGRWVTSGTDLVWVAGADDDHAPHRSEVAAG